ncbi:hypothetical protein [uncultured Psychroserpens sp.]|uniref:hypothetical protein n=1 Tax=uncultured Psychroserpens sp. TaxID=255436 RepID=UPI0026037428|nr:hypothetical protein [uncultured Psychroserpens sp.]
MKCFFSILIFTIFTQSLFSQINFQKGYIIKDNKEKISCYIKNEGWDNSPKTIKYKLTNSSTIEVVETKSIFEFGIEDIVRYRTIKTKIDVSKSKEIRLNSIELLAKVIIEGEAILYYNNDNDQEKYFYSVNDSEIRQLIRKEYFDDEELKYNNDYLVKLNSDVKCITESNFVRIKFNLSSLKNYFLEYNTCKNIENVYVSKARRVKARFKGHLGLNFSALDMEFSFNRNDFLDRSLSFKNEISPVIGFEGEFLLPTNNYKFSLNASAFYKSFKAEAFNEKTAEDFEVDLQSIQIILGARYLMYLNEESKFFIGPDVAMDIGLKNELTLNQANQELFGNIINDLPVNFSMVFGYDYKRFGAQLRYFFNTNLSTFEDIAEVNFSSIYLTATYRIF